MSIFRRRTDRTPTPADEAVADPRDESDGSDATSNDATTDDTTGDDRSTDTGAEHFDRTDGPFDLSEVDDLSGYLDLGALHVMGVEGMELRLEVDEEQQQVIAATATIDETSMQIQAFAAPRTSGLWAEVRDEIAQSIATQGGTADETVGVVGAELQARMPSAGPDGRTVFAPARFVGVDGPRWFLRGVVSGRGAIEDEAAAPLLDVFKKTVVVRGSDPRAPRELLPLQIPDHEHGSGDAEQPTAQDADTTDDLNPFERGPEITEVR